MNQCCVQTTLPIMVTHLISSFNTCHSLSQLKSLSHLDAISLQKSMNTVFFTLFEHYLSLSKSSVHSFIKNHYLNNLLEQVFFEDSKEQDGAEFNMDPGSIK
jgi:hypothetical protein